MGSSQPRDQTQMSFLAGGFFPTEPPGKPSSQLRYVHFFFYWQGKGKFFLGGRIGKLGKEGPQTLIPTSISALLPAPSFLSH